MIYHYFFAPLCSNPIFSNHQLAAGGTADATDVTLTNAERNSRSDVVRRFEHAQRQRLQVLRTHPAKAALRGSVFPG